MNQSNTRTCPGCGAQLPAAGVDQPCPACLLSGALAAPSGETASANFPRPFGDYRLLGVLGSGGMGTVYEAEDLSTGRRVALKMLAQQLDEPEMRQRFLREGRLAARVTHPNSLYVFGSEEIEGIPVITMEISSSGTLEDRIQNKGPLPVPEAVDAILDVIAGLEAAAAEGVLHRDVKPANCFVGGDGVVRVGDYGLSVSTLAREDTLVTAPGLILGTPAYAPPEQLRGDDLDLRADIYSVGATLYALLTGKLPFEGKNAVEIVAKVVEQAPKPLGEMLDDVPPRLEQVVACCLAKAPEGRFANYMSLRDALLPFSSREPEPASMGTRAAAGWIDYLIALLPPYLVLMFTVGAEALLVQPLIERTLFSFRYELLLVGLGCLYFAVAEGLWGAGLGKRLKGLLVVGRDGGRPGFGRALLRSLVPILSVEVVRIPLSMTFISGPEWTGLETALFVITFVLCGWIPALLALRARPVNGFVTLWDRVSGTRVVRRPKGAVRPALGSLPAPEMPADEGASLGPFRVIRELAPGAWVAATDPVLRRSVWLLRRGTDGPSPARREVARPGRLRWLQTVKTSEAQWDAYEAPRGRAFSRLVAEGKRVPWGNLRHWLHDLASELWAATRDRTLPDEGSLDHVWITADGRAVFLEAPWPDVGDPAECFPLGDLAGQQRFLSAVASNVEATTPPLHARPLLENLEQGRFEKLSFLTGSLRGILDRPTAVGRTIRACSIFMLPLYVWIAVFVGRYHDKPSPEALTGLVVVTGVVLFGAAIVQLLMVPVRSTVSQLIFRLAVIDDRGQLASRSRLLARWALVWLPLLGPLAIVAAVLRDHPSIAIAIGLGLLLPWLGAAILTVLHPNRGPHDRLAGTWVVRR